MIFENRQHAGKLLVQELEKQNIKPDLVYGLARGGVVVAAEVAAAFKVGLEALVVRKISPPGNSEFAVGAIAAIPGLPGFEPSMFVWWDKDTIRRLGLTSDWQKQQIRDKQIEISSYLNQLNFRENHMLSRRNLRKIILLVDDGAATGATMLAAIGGIRKIKKGPALRRPPGGRVGKAGPYQIIVVLPVASYDAAVKLRPESDKLVILHQDPDFRAVGQYYREFNQVSWDEIKTLLQLNREAYRKSHPRKTPQRHDRSGVRNERG